jgi:hypothetical protein
MGLNVTLLKLVNASGLNISSEIYFENLSKSLFSVQNVNKKRKIRYLLEVNTVQYIIMIKIFTLQYGTVIRSSDLK